MSRVAASVITIADGKISINAGPPAPRPSQLADANHRILFALARIAS